MGYLLVLVAAVTALVASLQDNSSQAPEHSFDTMRLYADHLALYRGWVRDYTQEQPALPFGVIEDDALTVFTDFSLPSFDHHARYAPDGNIYVWSNTGGLLYTAASSDNASASLCHVIASRQCVSGRSTTAVLGASQTPDFIPTGSTVYVWQH